MATATAAQSWMGVNINWSNVEDKSSESSFELLPEGFYRAIIQNAERGVLGENDKPALILTLELEDAKKEIVHSIYIPQQGDSESAIKFKNEQLRNFFTRTAYSKMTHGEYKGLEAKEVADTLDAIMKSAKGPKQFIGNKVTVNIKQEPFVARDKDTKMMKFTEQLKDVWASKMPRPLLKIIGELEKGGADIVKVPVFLFSNKVAGCGFGFYNDFDASVELKNSKAYDFVQENLSGGATYSEASTSAGSAKAEPTF